MYRFSVMLYVSVLTKWKVDARYESSESLKQTKFYKCNTINEISGLMKYITEEMRETCFSRVS